MDLSLTNSSSLIVYKTDLGGVHKEPLTSSKFWRRFAEMKIEGYSGYIKYFEPRLKAFEEGLQEFKDPTEEPWVQSITAQLEREKAQLNLFKSYRNTYGTMTVELRALDTKYEEEDTNLLKMKSDLKHMEEECKRINKKLAEEKAQMEGKLTKLENLILCSSPEVQRKANKLTKLAGSYEKHREERDEKIDAISKKSEEIFQKFEDVENKRTGALVRQWKVAMTDVEKNNREFRRTLHFNKGSTSKCNDIDVLALVEMNKRKRQRILRVQNFQQSRDLINKNNTCADFLNQNKVVLAGGKKKKIDTVEEDEKDEQDEKDEEDEKEEEDEPRTVVKPFNIEDDDDDVVTPMQQSSKPKSCWDEDNSTENIPEPTTRRPLPIPNKSVQDSTKSSMKKRPLPQPTKTTKNRVHVDVTSLQNDQGETSEQMVPYVVKIKAAFKKEAEGQLTVKKGDKVKVIQKDVDGFVMVKKKTKLGKTKQGTIPVYTFDKPADRASE